MHNRKHLHRCLAFSFLLIVTVVISCNPGQVKNYTAEKIEVETFLNNYKRLLQTAKFDSVALLYVDTAFISLGNGERAIQTLDSIKAFYGRFPKTPNGFQWDSSRVDILNKKTALVTSFFYWNENNIPDSTKFSYTGVYIKEKNTWKIKHEHESLDFNTVAKIVRAIDSTAK